MLEANYRVDSKLILSDEVRRGANKHDIRQAIECVFRVIVNARIGAS